MDSTLPDLHPGSLPHSQPVTTLPELGSEFAGYRLESYVARGGMGVVFEATHLRLHRRVALKLLAPELAEDRDFRERFLKEAELAAGLEHPSVVPVYDAGEEGGLLYLAMRYLAGGDLRSLLQRQGRLSLERSLSITEQIAGALDAAHALGLVHRDVKPANILFDERQERAYLGDFGVAKRQSSKGLTQTGSFLGSVDYCAPEQIESAVVDGRADVYALGGVFYHCLTGQPPYVRETEVAVLTAHLRDAPPALSRVRPDLPEPLDGVVVTAMAKYPQVRYQTAGEFAKALREAVASPHAYATSRDVVPAARSEMPATVADHSPLPSSELQTAALAPAAPTAIAVPTARGRSPVLVALIVGAFVLLGGAGALGGVLLSRGGGQTIAEPSTSTTATVTVTTPSTSTTPTSGTTTPPASVSRTISLSERMIPPPPPYRCVSPFQRDHAGRMGLRLQFANGSSLRYASSGPADRSDHFVFCGGTSTYGIPGYASAPVRFGADGSAIVHSVSGVFGTDFEAGSQQRRIGLKIEAQGSTTCASATDSAGHARRFSCTFPRDTRLNDVVLRFSVDGDRRYGVFAGIGDLRAKVQS
jgi:serine/threonine-protein kinase